MTIDNAELLLLTTGVLDLPDAANIRATRTIEEDLKARMEALLERTKPAKLSPLKVGKRFFPRLVAFRPDYSDMPEVEDEFGLATKTRFQFLQQKAKAELEARHRVTVIDTVLGPRPVPSSYLDEESYRVLADTIQDELRLVRDMASGVLISDQVALFEACLPETYNFLLVTMSDWLVKQASANPEWLPPEWLSSRIRILRKEPLEPGISSEITVPSPPSGGGKGKLDPKAFKTNVDLTL